MLLVTEFTTERGETFTVLQLLKRLRNAIIQIDGILFEHQERIETLEFDVEKLKDDVENIYSELLSIDIRLDTIDNRLYNIDGKIINIENNITNIETILNNHDADISTLNNLVTNITTDLNDLQDIVDSIPIVSESPLNGYIKIDGVDTPVFVGGGGGGVGGGGEIIASYNDYLDTEENTPTELKNLILSFDIPDYNKNIELSGMMAGQCNSQSPRGMINFYGYDEDNNEVLLITLDTDNGSGPNPYYRWQYIINLFGDGGGISLGVTANPPKENTLNNTNYDGPTVSRKNITSNKIKRIDIYVEYTLPNIGIFKLYPFNVLISKYSDDGSGGSGGSGESDSNIKVYHINGFTELDDGVDKEIYRLPLVSFDLYQYKKHTLTLTSYGNEQIILKFNNKEIEIYPDNTRNFVEIIIDYQIYKNNISGDIHANGIVKYYIKNTFQLYKEESFATNPIEVENDLILNVKRLGSVNSSMSSYISYLKNYKVDELI